MLPPLDQPAGHSTPDQTSPANQRGEIHVDHVPQVADSILLMLFVCPAWSRVCVEAYPANRGVPRWHIIVHVRSALHAKEISEASSVEFDLARKTSLSWDEESVKLRDVLLPQLNTLGGAIKPDGG